MTDRHRHRRSGPSLVSAEVGDHQQYTQKQRDLQPRRTYPTRRRGVAEVVLAAVRRPRVRGALERERVRTGRTRGVALLEHALLVDVHVAEVLRRAADVLRQRRHLLDAVLVSAGPPGVRSRAWTQYDQRLP